MDKEKIINEIFKKVYFDFIRINIPVSDSINPDVKLSRAQRKWGSCKMSKKPNDYRFHISISENCFKEPDYIQFISDTMAHELIHTVKGCFNHGAKFQSYARKAAVLGYTVNTTSKSSVEKTDDEKFNEAKHVLRCKSCGEIYYRFRFPKDPKYIDKIMCGRCRGRLEKIK